MDCSLSGSSAHGISQARILEWIAISFSRWSFWPRVQTQVSCTGRWILYHWATSEAKIKYKICQITFLFSTQELQSRVEMWKKSWGEGRKMEKKKVSSHNRDSPVWCRKNRFIYKEFCHAHELSAEEFRGSSFILLAFLF